MVQGWVPTESAGTPTGLNLSVTVAKYRRLRERVGEYYRHRGLALPAARNESSTVFWEPPRHSKSAAVGNPIGATAFLSFDECLTPRFDDLATDLAVRPRGLTRAARRLVIR